VHTFTLNKVSVEIDGLSTSDRKGYQRFFNGQEFEARIQIDGPVSLVDVFADYEFNWQGNVIWSGDSEEVVENDGGTLITRKFVSDGSDKQPEVQFTMTSPGGDIFHYTVTLNDTAIPMASLNQSAERGFEPADPLETDAGEGIDTFFPSSFPINPSTFSVTTNFTDVEGNVREFDKALADGLALVTIPQNTNTTFRPTGPELAALRNSILVASDTDFLKRTFINPTTGTARFSVEPKIGAAQITSKLTQDNGRLLRAVTGSDETLESEPIIVTSNALRLVRDEDGYRLIVSGYADMSRYNAVWARGGFRAVTAIFEREENGDYVSFFENQISRRKSRNH